MQLPPRDGVHQRYYLIHKPDTDPEVLKQADQCIEDVLAGKAKENHSAYPMVVRNQTGIPFLPSQLLDRYLDRLDSHMMRRSAFVMRFGDWLAGTKFVTL